MRSSPPRPLPVSLSAPTLLNRVLARGKLRQVQVLLKMTELGSVRATADAIGIPEVSVTQAIAELEDLVHTKLFQQHSGGVRTTAAGAALVPHARQVMWGLMEAAEALVAHDRRGRMLVRVLASGADANGLVEQVLPAFAERYPQVQVQLDSAAEEDPVDAIARGEVDLVACRRPAVVPEGWGFRELRADRFAVVCAPDHPLAKGKHVRWSELSRQVWLLPPHGSPARRRFDDLTSHTRTEPLCYGVITHVPAMSWWLLHDHDLLAFVPYSIVRELVAQGELVELPTEKDDLCEPLGLLQPHAGGEAAVRLSGFLAQQLAPASEADEGSGAILWSLHPDAGHPAPHRRH
jgi:DNA-binding transcriptional LysR family regulator